MADQPNIYDVLDPPGARASGAQPPQPAASNVYDTLDPPKPQPSFIDQLTDPEGWKRAGGLTARAIASGVAGLPIAAMDLGVGARNMATGEHNELPGKMWSDFLTEQGLPTPQTGLEKVGSFIESGLAGGAVPGGSLESAAQVPANFVAPSVSRAQVTAQLLKRAQDQGLVVPPSTTNPTLSNRVIEGIAGKENVQNFSRIANDAARTKIAATALKLNPDAPLTPSAVDAVKAEAGKAWDVGRQIPSFKVSDQYISDLAKVEKENTGANASFPGAANPDVAKVIDTYTQPSMTGDAGVSAMKLLRSKASDAFNSGNAELGRTYKGIAQAIENELERAAGNPLGGVPPGTIQGIRNARQLYAKASLVSDSMNPDGTVSAAKLAQAWRNDEPITGPLRDAAEFAAQYPKANLSASASGSPVSHLSSWESWGPAAVMLGLEHGDPHSSLTKAMMAVAAGAAIPAARQGARSFLLSPAGQRGAIPAASAFQGAPNQFTPQALAAGLAAQRIQ